MKIKDFANTLHSNFWNIGFIEEDIKTVLASRELNVHWMKHNYRDRWFADPFILKITENDIVVLVEEFSYKRKIGRIAKLTINRADYMLKDMQILLELPSHLSFPVIYRKDDLVYIMPENSQSGQTKMYQYDESTDNILESNVVCSLPLTDAIIVRAWGKQFVFSTKVPTHNSNTLQIYSFDEEKLVLNPLPIQELLYDSNVARNAGDVFIVDGEVYRPAQDCNRWYGSGIVIERINFFGGVFSSEYVKTYSTTEPPYDMGYHTFNMKDGLIVIDAHGHRFKTANNLLNLIARIRNR